MEDRYGHVQLDISHDAFGAWDTHSLGEERGVLVWREDVRRLIILSAQRSQYPPQ